VRLQLILRGKRIGFSLDEIREIIGLYHSPHGEEAQRQVLLEKLSERRQQLLEQRRLIDQMLNEMADIEAKVMLAGGAPSRKQPSILPQDKQA
jgi:DNA-binding transcriptional MerR regulator